METQKIIRATLMTMFKFALIVGVIFTGFFALPFLAIVAVMEWLERKDPPRKFTVYRHDGTVLKDFEINRGL